MEEQKNSFDIEHSAVQIVPNAQYTIQNFYGVEYSKHILNGKHCGQETSAEGEIANMFYYSATKPRLVANEVSRKAELTMCEKRLAEVSVLCLYGEDGVGVTTLLAQFAREHGENCVSYFYNGLDIMLLNPEIMEHSVVEQLYWYVKGK